MSKDFDDALRALAESAARTHAQGTPLPLAEMTARARRNRRTHTALVSGVAAAAVLALGITGTTLLTSTEPPPPANAPTPAPTTTRQPEPTRPVVLPSADPTLPFGVCGSTPDATPERELSDVLTVKITAPTAVTAGEHLSVELDIDKRVLDAAGELDLDPVGDVGLIPRRGPALVATRDGVVVATGDVHGGGRTEEVELYVNAITSDIVEHVGAFEMSVCPADGASEGRPLPAGTYDLHALLPITVLPATTDDVPDEWTTADPDDLRDVDGARAVVIRSEPVTIEVEGEADTVTPWPAAVAPAENLPAVEAGAECLPAVPTPTAPGRLFALDTPTDRITAQAGETVALAGRLTYQGPGRAVGSSSTVLDLAIVRDGEVVGYAGPGGTDVYSELTRQRSMTSAGRPALWVPKECGDAGQDQPLGPGDYVAYPVAFQKLGHVVLDDGTVVDFGTGPDNDRFLTMVVGAPVPLTIE